jgi:hypothetical protein
LEELGLLAENVWVDEECSLLIAIYDVDLCCRFESVSVLPSAQSPLTFLGLRVTYLVGITPSTASDAGEVSIAKVMAC